MDVTVQVGVSKDCKNHKIHLEKNATVGDLRRNISEAEKTKVLQVTLIVKGRKLEEDEATLSELLTDSCTVIAVIGKKKVVAESKNESKNDAYDITFERKPFGIKIQSNRLQRDAFVINFEGDYGRNSGARLGSKVTNINGVKVAGWKTVDIEDVIMKAELPVRLTLLPKEAIPQSELSDVEGLYPEIWVPNYPERSEKSKHLKNPSDYIVKVEKRQLGISIFGGSGGRGAYIVAFLSDYGPSIGMKVGSMVVAINGIGCEDWLCNNILKQLGKADLPYEVTLRGSEGLTSKQFPVLVQEQADDEKMDALKPSPKVKAWIQEDMFSLVFKERPLGFGIMSPLGVGVMVSSVQHTELLEKGMIPGSPILAIGGIDVRETSLAKVARVLARAKLPLTIDFSKEMYFEPGDKVLVQFKDTWYQTTIHKFNPVTRKLSVYYDDKPFWFKNSECIQDFTRIRKLDDYENQDLDGIFSIHA